MTASVRELTTSLHPTPYIATCRYLHTVCLVTRVRPQAHLASLVGLVTWSFLSACSPGHSCHNGHLVILAGHQRGVNCSACEKRVYSRHASRRESKYFRSADDIVRGDMLNMHYISTTCCRAVAQQLAHEKI